MSEPLYKIANDYLQAIYLMDDPEVSREVVFDTLDCCKDAVEVKINSIQIGRSEVVKELDYAKSVRDRADKKVKDCERKLAWLDNYTMHNMELIGLDKVKGKDFTVSIRQNPPSIIIDDEKELYAEYLTIVPQTYVANKQKIKEHLKAGKTVPGCHLESKRRLEIK